MRAHPTTANQEEVSVASPNQAAFREPPSRAGSDPSIPLRTVGLATAVVLLAAALAFLISALGDPVYGARAEIIFRPARFASDTGVERQIQTQVALFGSRAVLEPVAASNGVSIEDLADAVSVEVIDQSEVLEVTVAADAPDRAQELAQDVVTSYAKQSSADGTVEFDAAEEPGGAQQEKKSGATEESDETGEESNPRITILTAPFVLEDPLKPKPLQAAAAGALAGLVIASCMVFVLAQMRSR